MNGFSIRRGCGHIWVEAGVGKAYLSDGICDICRHISSPIPAHKIKMKWRDLQNGNERG